MSPTFALLVPVKTLALAKSRLERPATRGALMRAFALDAIAAAVASPAVAQVYVVTDEPGFDADATRLPDGGGGDLNEALRHAERQVRALHPGVGVAAMCADLPALATDDLTVALRAGTSHRWFVADAPGTGTTLLVAEPGAALDPHFGVASARRHAESGAVPVRADVTTLRADVDTDADLEHAHHLGLGASTTRALVSAHL